MNYLNSAFTEDNKTDVPIINANNNDHQSNKKISGGIIMHKKIINSSKNNDSEVVATMLNTCDRYPDATESAIPGQLDIMDIFSLPAESCTKLATAEETTSHLSDDEHTEVFTADTIIVEIPRAESRHVLNILNKSSTRYKAVSAGSRVWLYFLKWNIKKCYHGALLCGIPARIAVRTGYLKPMEGSVEVLHADDSYSMIPLWLCPVNDCKPLNSTVSLLGEAEWTEYMKKVYEWLKKDDSDAYSKTIETAKILNRHFRKHPFNESRMTDFLNQMELELDMKDFDKVETDRNGKKKTVFLKDQFAEWFIERYHLINLNYIAHRYSNGVYIPTLEADCNSLLHKYLPNSTLSSRREIVQTVCSLLGIYARETTSESDMYYDRKVHCKPEMIAFNNGIYDISTNEWFNFSPDIIITNRTPIDYIDFGEQIGSGVKTEAMEIIDSWLDSFSEGNKKKRAVLEEVAGLALYHRNMGLRRQHTILTGIPASGKSTFIQMVERLVGKENCCHISMEDICNQSNLFCTYSLVGTILNSYADLPEQTLKSTARLKNICTNDAIQVQQKYMPATTLVWEGKMLYGCNKLPFTSDEALIDRFEIIPCNARYDTPDRACNRNLYTGDDLLRPDCLQYWCYLAVQGLRRFIANNYSHTCCEEIELFRERFAHKVNPIAAFIGSLDENEINGHETGEVFAKYINYCENELELPAENIEQFTKNRFTTSLKKYNYFTKRKSVNNDKIQVYVKCS